MGDGDIETANPADDLQAFLKRLFPICRSLTGEGNRQTLRILQEIIPLDFLEIPSGESVFDWQVPPEWNIRDGWIKNDKGDKLVSFKDNNLHVVGYSCPVEKHLTFEELAPNLHWHETLSDAIPYRTNYYKEDWGFCVDEGTYNALSNTPGRFEIFIDSELCNDGSMSLGELFIPGKETEKEYLVSTYICHPSMANDNLSGILVAAFLARSILDGGQPNYGWRFLFAPETIGVIAYLCRNKESMKKILGGLVTTCCGGPGPIGYKESFMGDSVVDRAAGLAFKGLNIAPLRHGFSPTGSDERQYSSPGFRIPVASITKDKYYEYPEYHTSLDNLDLVTGAQISESLSVCREVVKILDSNCVLRSKTPWGEPQLGKRELYPSTGGNLSIGEEHEAGDSTSSLVEIISWLMFCADEEIDLIDITAKTGKAFKSVLRQSEVLAKHGLVEKDYRANL